MSSILTIRTHTNIHRERERERETFEGVDMPIIFMVVVISPFYARIQAHQIVHIKCV